jgi:hypothetical protein
MTVIAMTREIDRNQPTQTSAKRIKSFCIVLPMQKLGWTERGARPLNGALWNFQLRAWTSRFGLRSRANGCGVG